MPLSSGPLAFTVTPDAPWSQGKGSQPEGASEALRVSALDACLTAAAFPVQRPAGKLCF